MVVAIVFVVFFSFGFFFADVEWKRSEKSAGPVFLLLASALEGLVTGRGARERCAQGQERKERGEESPEGEGRAVAKR